MSNSVTTSVSETYWAKLVLNAKTSIKFASVRVSALITFALLTYASLPSDCTGQAADCLSRAAVGNVFHIPAWVLTLIGFASIYYARIHPEKSVTPNEAAAKSMDAPQPVDGAGDATK